MKILYFYQYFSTPKGSWGTRAYEFSKNWVEQGHEVTVVTSIYTKSDLKANNLIEDQIFEGIHVKVLNILIDNKQNFYYRIYTFLLYAILSSFYALTEKADVVIASSGPITVGIPGLIARLRGRKLVFETRDLWPDNAIEIGLLRNPILKRLAHAFEKLCYKYSSLIVTLSPGMQKHIKNRYGFIHSISVPNSANLTLFGESQNSVRLPAFFRTHYVAIYTGNIGQVNNCMLLFNTAYVLQQRGIKNIIILLIGEGQQREELEQIADINRLNNFKILRLMPKQELVPFVQNSMVSIVPLKDTPVLGTSSPNKLFESLAAGVPVIQTTKGWISDFLKEHECGFNVDANDFNKLADLLVFLSQQPELLKRMSLNAKQVASAQFDKDILSTQMLTGLLKVVNN